VYILDCQKAHGMSGLCYPLAATWCSFPPEWFLVDALGSFYGVTGYDDAFGGAPVYEITPQINLAWGGGFPVASGLVRHC